MGDFRNNDGLGVQGIVDGHAVLVGRSQLSREWSVTLTDDLQRANKDTEQKAAPLGRVVDLRAATRQARLYRRPPHHGPPRSVMDRNRRGIRRWPTGYPQYVRRRVECFPVPG